MHIRCPHCNNPIEILDDASLSDISCPSCGSGFNLIGDETIKVEGFLDDTIGHFTLSEKLGIGAFGTVWKAIDTELDRTVAIKIPRKDQLDAEETEQFLREARAVAQLKHPNIVSVHEVGRDAGRVYIVSDYVDGITLADWITGQQATPDEAAELCLKIAEALHHAHEQGVIHRDLKPGNIMMEMVGSPESRVEGEKDSSQKSLDSRPSTLDFTPYIMDFGLAKRDAGEITMTVEGKILGTPAYMSPEQARGEGHHADARSDIYSLGVILYELLTGEKPFRGNQRMLLHQVLNEEPKSLRSLNDRIPKDLETITLKCMEKEPDKRYSTALIVAKELTRYLNDEPILARPIGRIERWRRWGKRNPLVASLSTAVVMTLLIGTVVSSYFAIETNAALGDAKAANRKKNEALAAKETALKETRKTIDNYVETVQNAELLKEERFKPLMKELLKAALAHYERFIDQHEHDNESLDDLAKALFRVASLSHKSGDVEKAIEAYRRTIEIREKLVANNPTVTAYQNDLAKSHNNLGILYQTTNQPDEALLSYKKALEIRMKLVEEKPTVTEYQNMLATSHNNLGILYQTTGQQDEAFTSYKRAIEIEEKLVKENPTMTDYRNDLAKSHNNIGRLYQTTNQPDEALLSYKKALEIRMKLVEEKPTVTEYQNMLATSHNNLGILYQTTGQQDEAFMSYKRAIEIEEKLVKENPTMTEFQNELARSLGNMGILHHVTGKMDESFLYYKRSLEIQEKLTKENPTVTEYKNGLANSHHIVGILYQKTGQQDKALVSYKNAIDIRQRLIEKNPNLIKVGIGLGNTCINYANLARDQKDYQTATTFYELGVKTLLKVVKRNPRHQTAKESLRNAYWSRAELMEILGRFDDAVAAWDKAIEFDSGKQKANFQKFRDAAAAKTKLQKQNKKKQKSKPTSKKKSVANRDKPLIAPRPKFVALKPRG